jgi:hypothetical protein
VTLTYTTVEAIERRLKGWATINAQPTVFGTTQLDEDLVLQLAGQAEARINQVLRDRYQLPLAIAHEEIASVAEKLTICQLIGQLYAGQEPSEKGGYGALMCSQGERELAALAMLDLVGEVPLGTEVGRPLSGERSQPAIYLTGRSTPKISPIRW